MMFKIRQQVLDALASVAVKVFEDRMVAYLSGAFPNEAAARGEAEVRSIVEQGVGRAEAYGLVTEHDICCYVEVMWLLGRHFDTDPRYAFATDVLRAAASPSRRARQLIEATNLHLSSPRHAT